MRIGVLAHNYPPHPGGLEVMVENVSARLAERHEVVVVTAAWADAPRLESRGRLRIHRLPALHHTERRGVPYPVVYGPGVAAALRELSTCDVLHAHGALYVGSLAAERLARIRRMPMVLTEHVGFVPYSSALVVGIEKAAWALIGDRVVTASSAIATYNARVQQWMQHRYPRRDVLFVGNGVDCAQFRPLEGVERREARASFGLPADAVLVLYAGRATEKKNFPTVRAIPRRGFQLVACGADRRLDEPGIIDLGVVQHERMAALYGAVDLFVLASVGEGFPLSLQEAMASGCPAVVLWDAGYSTSLDRVVVQACETLDQIGPAVQALVAGSDARAELSRRARRWAMERWSWEATVSAYERIFTGLVAA
jgi:glycosyltransferase involved in cell wall biosynthesis